MKPAAQRVLSQLSGRLDPGAILAGEAVDARYGDDLSGIPGARPELVLRPRDTRGVAEALRACNAAGQTLVVQGGRTGLCGGARTLSGEAVLSLERMTRLEAVEPMAATIIAEAGVPLQAVQEAADTAGLCFGVDIGARGTATIGGNVATNAGGIRVLRYGTFRAQVLGLEVALADGSVLSSMKGLAKDNSGYDLNQLFIGSEGTLGVVTRACLRLHPKPVSQAAAWCALPSLDAALSLLKLLRARLGNLLGGFEILFEPLVGDMAAALGITPPLPVSSPVHVLADIQGMAPGVDEEAFAAVLGEALESGLARDVVLSQSPREYQALWALRDECNRFLFSLPPMVGLDVSVPLPRMGAFLEEAEATARRIDPACVIYVFGHLGDGNLHYMVGAERPEAVTKALFVCLAGLGGAITAEHGVGLDKRAYLPLVRSADEIAAMRRLKAAFDPENILNPGRVFDMVPAGRVAPGVPA
jgi:FAD/FMN-containing dehydrogenase